MTSSNLGGLLDREVGGLRTLENAVDNQLVLRRLLDREIGRLRALEDFVRVDRELPAGSIRLAP
jgi:hypothetical protein